jgi:hypothetical protein
MTRSVIDSIAYSMSQASESNVSEAATERNQRAALIATRLRQTARSVSPPAEARLPSFAIEHAVAGDAGHLHRAHNLSELPIESHRRVSGKLMVEAKRGFRRMLHPLVETQTSWNAANARVVTFMLRQMAAQARSIESLEQQVEELQKELHP